jgi:hypothetical protein
MRCIFSPGASGRGQRVSKTQRLPEMPRVRQLPNVAKGALVRGARDVHSFSQSA